MERVVSLLPSTTEIVCALGAGERLVGRSHECDHPPGVERLPALTEPKLDAAQPGRAIDNEVRRLVSEGLSVYRVDAERLRELEPTLVLTQDQCEVCAASLGDVERALAQWLGARPRVVSLSPAGLGDVWKSFEQAAEALGEPARGRALLAELEARVASVAERALRIRERPSVACIEWIDPLMAAGNWMPELVTLAGGRNLFGEAGQHSPWLEWDALRAADPEVIAVLPCGFDLARTRREMPPLAERPGWKALAAVRAGRVYLADGHQYFNRPGPRLADSLEVLAEMLHPDHFPARYRGAGWQPWSPAPGG